MKFNKYYLMSAVFCMALASCSDDVITDDGNGIQNPTEVVEGTPTWANFSINVKTAGAGSISRAAGEATTALSDDEKVVSDITLLVFRENDNDQDPNGSKRDLLEVCEVLSGNKLPAADQNAGTYTHTFLLTSGQKKVYALINAVSNGIITGSKDQGYKIATGKTVDQAPETFDLVLNKTTLAAFETVSLELAYTDNTAKSLGDLTKTEGSTAKGLLMTGLKEQALAPGVNAGNLGATTNKIEIDAYRVSAKVTMGVLADAYANDNVFTIKTDVQTPAVFKYDHTVEAKLGTVVPGHFMMFNQNKLSYLWGKKGSQVGNSQDAILEDPNYDYSDAIGTAEYFSKNYYNYTNSDWNTVSGGVTTTQIDMYNQTNLLQGELKVVSKGLASTAEVKASAYIPENTNLWAVKGNTTYAMVEGAFTPEKTRTVKYDQTPDNSVNAATTAGSLLFVPADAAITAGNTVLYCPEYGVFFDGGSDLTARKDGGADESIITAGDGGTRVHILAAFQIIAAKMISDAYKGATSDKKGDYAALTIKPSDITATTEDSKAEGKWYVKVTPDAGINSEDYAKSYTLSVYYGGNTNKPESYDSKTIEKKNVTLYYGGKCYYRINIENPAYSAGFTPFRYAVLRNHWYQIDLAAFKNIGYANPALAAGTATESLGTQTNVDAVITLKDWDNVYMKPEVDL